MGTELIVKTMDMISDALRKIDKVNKDLIKMVCVIVVSFCVTVVVVVGIYFLSDYSYATQINQTQTSGNDSKTNVNVQSKTAERVIGNE